MIGLHTALAPLIARVLRHYVDGISKENVHASLLGRKLRLSDVTLRKDALDGLALPCNVVKVRVRVLEIAFRPFARDSIVVKVDGVECELEQASEGDDDVDYDELLSRRDAREKIMEEIARDLASRVEAETSGGVSKAIAAAALERLSFESAAGSVTFRTRGSRRGVIQVGWRNVSIRSASMTTSTSTSTSSRADDEDGDGELSGVRASKRFKGVTKIMFSGDTRKRVELNGLSVIVNDGGGSSGVVIGPDARLRMDAHLHKRPKRERYEHPNASVYVVKMDVKDKLEALVSASQVKMVQLAMDDMEMWAKRRAHGERRPKTKNPVDWWRYAVRATVPRGKRHRARVLETMRRAKAHLKSYIEIHAERSLGKEVAMPKHLQSFEAGLSKYDLVYITQLAEVEAAKRRKGGDSEMDSWLPSEHTMYSASQIFGTSEDVRRPRTSTNTSTSSSNFSSYVYAKGTGYLSKAYGYMRFPSLSRSSEVSHDEFKPEATIVIPGVSVTMCDQSMSNRVRFTARGISLNHGPLVNDVDGVLSETVLTVDQVHGEDLSNDRVGKMIWARVVDGDDARPAVVVKLNPDSCPDLDVLMSTHVKLSPHAIVVQPSTIRVLMSMMNALDTPFATAFKNSALALNSHSPQCRLGIIESLGSGLVASPTLIEVDSPLIIISSKPVSRFKTENDISGALAFGVEKFVLCTQNGLLSREDVFDKLVEESSTSDFENVNALALRTRTFARVDGAWASASNAPMPIVSDVKMTLVNDITLFDSDTTMVNLGPLELEFTPESMAALLHAVAVFSDVAPSSSSSSTTPAPVDSAVKFEVPKIKVSLKSGDDRLEYVISDVNVAMKGSSNDWRMKSTIGQLSGEHVSGFERTALLKCSSPFMKANVCSRVAGIIEVGTIEARCTRQMLNMLSDMAFQTKGIRTIEGDLVLCPRMHECCPIQSEFEKAWSSVETFDIPDTGAGFLRGTIEPMCFKLFEESDETDALILTTHAMEICGNVTHVELELHRMLLSILNVRSQMLLFDVEEVRAQHSVGTKETTSVRIGSIALEVTPESTRRLVAIMQTVPQIPSLSIDSPKSNTNAGIISSLPNLDLSVKSVKLSAKDEDEVAVIFSDVATRIDAHDKAVKIELNIDSAGVDVTTRSNRDRPFSVIKLNDKTHDALKVVAEGISRTEMREEIKVEVHIGDGVVEFNAPYIIAAVNVCTSISRSLPEQNSSPMGTTSRVDVERSPSITAELSTGMWTFQLPWRSELERHAPLRMIRLRTRQAVGLHEFVLGSTIQATFFLQEFKLETGYCKDEQDQEDSSVMFTLAEVTGLETQINVPATSSSYCTSEVVPKFEVTAESVSAHANEISLHLLIEIAELVMAQPATAQAIEAYDALPQSASSKIFEASLRVDVITACLEYSQVHRSVPIVQAMMTNMRAEMRSSNLGADINVNVHAEVDYLHPVKAAWEPIIESTPFLVSTKMTTEFQPTSVTVSVASGLDVTVSPSVVEALLKAQVVVESAQTAIADLEHSTSFGPCSYQMTNVTGFDVDYGLSYVRDGAITHAGEGTTVAGDTQLMRFAKREEKYRVDQHRVFECGASYWASPIDDDDVDGGHGQDTAQEPVPHVSVEFKTVDVDAEPISLHGGMDEERRLLEYAAHLEDGSSTRIIAEIGPCSTRVNRYELLLRSDVSILNGTSFPIVMCFQHSVALPSTIFGPIFPGESAWLPIPLCKYRKVQWRAMSLDEDFEDFGDISAVDADVGDSLGGSPFLSPLQRGKKSATSQSPRLCGGSSGPRHQHHWSTAFTFNDLITNDGAIAASLCSTASAQEVESSKPYTCALVVTRSEEFKRVQLALCSPLRIVNALPLQLVVTCCSKNAFKHDMITESRVVSPGESVLFTTLHPTWSATVTAQIIGYETCEDLIVPEYTQALKTAKRRSNGEIYHIDRDAKPVDRKGSQDSFAAVSLRFAFSIDDVTQVRTLHCAAPLIILNATSCAIVLEDMLHGIKAEDSTLLREAESNEMIPQTQQGKLTSTPLRLFEEDAENFETPPPVSPFARLAQNQALPQLSSSRSSTVFTDASPVLLRQSSLRLNAESINFVTPTTPGQHSTPSVVQRSEFYDKGDNGVATRVSILGSSAHWRKKITHRPRVRIRLKASRFWSRPFRISPDGVPIEISVPSESSADVCEHRFIATSSVATTEKMYDTAKLDIRPKFLIKSTLDEAIWIRHGGTEHVELLPARTTRPLKWFDWRGKKSKIVMFRPEKGVFEWSKPVIVPDHVASILKMHHIGVNSSMHTETITVSILENDDSSFTIRIARPTEIDGILGMHTIENHSNVEIWYHQLGTSGDQLRLGPKESDERMIEDSSLPRALVIGYGELPLGEPISLDVSREISYSVVTTDRNCLRITVTREGPMCSVIIEDALGTRVSTTPERPILRPKSVERDNPQVDFSLKCNWIGMSMLHGHEELMYARMSDVAVKTITDGSEFKSALRVKHIRVDHTSTRAKRPIVLDIPERHQSAREAMELQVHGWMHRMNGLPVVRSLKIDLAPAFIDIHDELIDVIPLAIEPCMRHAELLLPPAKPNKGKSKGSNKRQQEGETMSALTSVYLQELIINDVELILSFSRLPGLPIAIRSLAGVDRARLRMKGFHMNQPSLMAADVGAMAARHFSREAVVLASSLWAHNSLLGDPKRLWEEIFEAFNEFHSGSTVTALPRVVMALTAAFAHSGEVALSQARDVVEGWLEALEASQSKRRFALQTRRLGAVEDSQKKVSETLLQHAFDTVARVIFDVIDGPLSGMEIGGVWGMMEGSAIGALSAFTRVLATILDASELSARRLRLFAAIKTFDESEYMRPRRPLPTSYMDPVRPYHYIEAIGRMTLAKLETSERDEKFVAAATMSWPSYDFCILTGGKLLIISRPRDAGAIPYVRSSVRFVDITGVLRDSHRVSINAVTAVESMQSQPVTMQSALDRAYSFALSALGRFRTSASTYSTPNDEASRAYEDTTPRTVVVRCADEDAAHWLTSALSPFVHANSARRQ
ncbi:Vacuolar protein sorting-associated protein 13A N-terminal domain [Ostreococcus tauri]|uniref:Vacuolar protein sorting-associated protein 13A N-terminal domain n=1 Tax=Ostreococcus tauri TaxID=70448 RepID=A0A090LZK3_OSTTA|nr:Vacuolar protein sorting-associated protein 13A N-terminal domain [Ostreococcus tauri]CEF97351.1 Vacuolar protein sorting-associated protein 13A N-terminal domain [Ostreococcus tauri]|eukprot:XP_022838646.1 Vacuolar protein sorting-associated protein 13A N-terminal domain [Ostreococcus tauri]